MDTAQPDAYASSRIRYATQLRQLTVTGVQKLTPNLVRISLRGDFDGFQSLGFDDHIKLFFADPETGVLTLPEPDAPPPSLGPKPVMRDYTPRRFDGQTLDIEFALHGEGASDAGPATLWAMRAAVGDTLHIGGPRGSTLISSAFDGYMLIGDDTALPAIARRLAELPAGMPVRVLAEVNGPDDRLNFQTNADLQMHWVYRPNSLNSALKSLHLPQASSGAWHVWVACGSSQAKLIRAQLIEDHGINPQRIKAAGYWRAGATGVHEPI